MRRVLHLENVYLEGLEDGENAEHVKYEEILQKHHLVAQVVHSLTH